jgi:uncharacterized protein (DUF1330 family)
MAYGYVIAQISVKDPEAYKEYVAEVTPIVAKFGGEYLIRGGQSETVEGVAPGARTVVIRFPSYQAAHLSDNGMIVFICRDVHRNVTNWQNQ